MLEVAYKMPAFGNVIYGRAEIGMGIVFTTVDPEDQTLPMDLIAELAIPQGTPRPSVRWLFGRSA